MLLSLITLYEWDNTLFQHVNFPPSIDKQTAVNTILSQNAELEVVYSDPAIMKQALGWWSAGRQWSWKKYAELLELEYNPVENYNRVETYTGTQAGKSDSVSKNAVYNQTDLVESASGEATASSETTNTGTVRGNIGVTTTQEMIQGELKLDAQMNIYDFISFDFKQRFCILVY